MPTRGRSAEDGEGGPAGRLGREANLADLGTQDLEDVTQPPKDGEVAENSVLGLVHIADAKHPIYPDNTTD